MTVNGKNVAELEAALPAADSGTLVPIAFAELGVAKAWGKDADQWDRISESGQVLMTAYEGALSRLTTVQAKQK